MNDMQIYTKIMAIFFTLAVGAVAAQQPKNTEGHQKIQTYLNAYRVNYAPEKIFIHHDKGAYMAGEVIWLKAYVVAASSLLATKKSGVLYVAVRDEEDNEVAKAILPIENGVALGDIHLNDSLSSGKYKLLAYTTWMRNFEMRDAFYKKIEVIGNSTARTPPEETPDMGTLSFFPESGDLIAGIEQEVAIKYVDSNGQGKQVYGKIIDADSTTITDFETLVTGMGATVFTPQEEKQYFAVLNGDSDHIETRLWPLPPTSATGLLMRVNEYVFEEGIRIQLHNQKMPAQNVTVVGIARDSLFVAEELFLAPDQIRTLSIPREQVPAGVVQFALIDRKGQPYAERLVFVPSPKAPSVSIDPDADAFDLREEIKIDLSITSEENQVSYDVSVAVIADNLAGLSERDENIQSYLLLSSDLRGRIENPGFYFDQANGNRLEALRYLMMTQGWRRFTWQQFDDGKLPEIRFSNEPDLQLWGRVTRADGRGVRDGEVLLFLKDQYQTFITAGTNEDGYFAFQGFYFRDTIDIVLQGTDNRGRTTDIKIEVVDHLGTVPTPPFLLSSTPLANRLPEGYKNTVSANFRATEAGLRGMGLNEFLLDEVVVKGRAEVREPFRLHRNADVTISREQLPIAPSGNILESLQGRVAGLQVIPMGANEFRAVIRGQGSPLFLLDGMPVPESTVQMLNQFDISRVEILKGPGSAGIYGGRAAGGVIALYTRRGGEDTEVDPESGDHIMVYRMGGFSRTREFYQPKYDGSESGDYYAFPDLRTTIHWNPQIIMDSTSSKSVRFFAADTPGPYRVVLQGMGSDGTPVFGSTIIHVGEDKQ